MTGSTTGSVATTQNAGLFKVDNRFGPRKPRTLNEQLNHQFDELIEQSGIDVTPATALAVIAAVSVFLGGAMFVWQENLLAAALGLIAGLAMSVLYLRSLRTWRFRQIQRQLPEAVEVLGRSVRAGRSLEQALEDLGRELPHPLGPEFQRVTSRLELGLAPAAAVRELPERIPLTGMHIFTAALSMHQQTGGNLTHLLDQLAQTIRERAEFRGKFMAATAGSRFSVLFLLAIGPMILAYQSLRDPNYLATLTGTAIGRTILLGAITLQVIGSAWIIAIFRSGVSETEL